MQRDRHAGSHGRGRRRARRATLVGVATALTLGGASGTALARTHHSGSSGATVGFTATSPVKTYGVDVSGGVYVLIGPKVQTAGVYYLNAEIQGAMGDQDQFACSFVEATGKKRRDIGVEGAFGKFTPSPTSDSTYVDVPLTGAVRLPRGSRIDLACEGYVPNSGSYVYHSTLTGVLIDHSTGAL